METFGEAGVPCSAVLDTRELHEDPHLLERNFVKMVEHHGYGEVPLLGFAPRMSESDVELTAAPLLGQHSEEVLSQDLGIDRHRFKALRDAGIVE